MNGQEEVSKTLTYPAEAVQSFLSQNPNFVDPSTLDDRRDATDYAIRHWAPEAEQATFCAYNINNSEQVCADLDNYKVNAYNAFQNEQYFPADYYSCIDDDCTSGVQNVVFLGNHLYAYFRDSADGQYYQASADIDAFFENGSEALTIVPVTNRSGESEIMASANALRDLQTDSYTEFTVDVSDDSLTVNFNHSLNSYAALPDFSLNNESVSITDVSWNDERTQVNLSFDFSALTSLTQVEIDHDNVFFLTDSATRYKLPTITLEVGGTDSVAVEPTFKELLSVKAIAGKNTVPSIIANPGNLYSFSIRDLDSELFSIDPLTGKLSFIMA